MTLHPRAALCAALLLIVGCAVPLAASTPLDVLQALAAYLDSLSKAGEFSGTVLAAHNGEVVLERAYGLADRAHMTPNGLDTQFNLASMGKMFTGVAILQLVEQGKLSLSAKLSAILSDYPNQDVASRVSIHELLTHTAGVADWMGSSRYTELRGTLRRVADYLPLFVDEPLEFVPGTQYSYSNSGYILLGLVIEKVSGEDYFDYVREHIFSPAGMTHTDSYTLDALPPSAAIGYTTLDGNYEWTLTWRGNGFVLPMRGSSDGGGYSTAHDLLAFSQALLGNRLLSAADTDLVLKGKVEAEDPTRWYAYGFQDKVLNGQRVVGHGGSFPGVNSFLDMYVDSGYVLVVLTNRDNGVAVVRDFLASRPLI